MPHSYYSIIKKIKILHLVVIFFFYSELYASNSAEKEQLDVPQICFTNLGKLSSLPKELIEKIFSYYPQQIHHLNRSSFTIMTGYNPEDLSKGMTNPPRYRTYPFASAKKINFRDLSSLLKDIPSYLWFKKVTSVAHIPKEYWPHIRGTQINFVRIFYSNLEASGVKEFAQVLQGSQLHIINLAGNNIGDTGAEYLSMMTNLTHVNLRNNNVGAAGAESLSKMTNLTHVNLKNNNVGAAGAESLSKMMNLTKLDLSDNNIDAAGAKSLSTMSNLKKMSLSFNNIGVAGIHSLSAMTNLMHLNLFGTNLDNSSIESLSTMTNLIKLDLSCNDIDEATQQKFIEALPQCDISF